MPAELRLHIVGFLDRARDMAAALIASRLFAGRSAVAMAIQEGAVYTGRLLEAGAPLDIVERTILARPRPLGRSFVESAVRGGHMDVLRFVCILVEVRPQQPFSVGVALSFSFFYFFLFFPQCLAKSLRG
ncbi:hypothetical protein TW95_gp1632 [Pandoravirus inopinatum]|uniref:Uncharacterized protein n=1 Tax=Pandoravirus inopinatum TaxID=1605721 RepID=A0A0B5JBH3_9VIRU|nr:hypothetical protein TW95_gp1632 [Pandoravirus inopinatum]AJF98366.1 hypothetical protein [Pandoravirus inopinatum]